MAVSASHSGFIHADRYRYGTAVEHHSLYQYQFSSSESVVAGFIQTETP